MPAATLGAHRVQQGTVTGHAYPLDGEMRVVKRLIGWIAVAAVVDADRVMLVGWCSGHDQAALAVAATAIPQRRQYGRRVSWPASM